MNKKIIALVVLIIAVITTIVFIIIFKEKKNDSNENDRYNLIISSIPGTDNPTQSQTNNNANVLPSKTMPSRYLFSIDDIIYYSVDIIKNNSSDSLQNDPNYNRKSSNIVCYTTNDIGDKIGDYDYFSCGIEGKMSNDNKEGVCFVYEINNIDKRFAVAVKHTDVYTEYQINKTNAEYQIFVNHNYAVSDLHDFFDSINIDANSSLKGAYFTDKNGNPETSAEETDIVYADGHIEKIHQFLSLPLNPKEFKALLKEKEIPLVQINSDSDREILGNYTARIILDYILSAQWESQIDVYENGYISTDIGYSTKYFYVGKDAVDQLVETLNMYKGLLYN